MRAVPAIDLRDGACVQLVGGAYARERVRLPDPVAVAERWLALGFAALHVVDLDAATGAGSNLPLVERLAALPAARVQVGGGVRDEAAAARLLDAGAARVVIGTRAVEDLRWCEALTARFPGAIVVAADVADGCVASRGWSERLPLAPATLLARLESLPLAGVLVTAVDREGREAGPDLELTRLAAAATRHPLIASGGIAALADLAALAAVGAAEVVLGMALYTGTLDAREVAREYGR